MLQELISYIEEQMGTTLNRAEFYLPPSDEETRKGLLTIWDFFEGLLAEGYVAE